MNVYSQANAAFNAHPDLPAGFCDIFIGRGPVLSVALHAGHRVRPILQYWLAAGDEVRRRNEEPMTEVLASAADSFVTVRQSLFDTDLNRPRPQASTTKPAREPSDFWHADPPSEVAAPSFACHDAFYAQMRILIEGLLREHGKLLVLDIHSFNYRDDAGAAGKEQPPDIDLGVTECNGHRWGRMVNQFADALQAHPVCGRRLRVTRNERCPRGGYFPQWVRHQFDDRVCVVTLRYKKFFMEEWSGIVDLAALCDAQDGLRAAIENARPFLKETTVRRKVRRQQAAF